MIYRFRRDWKVIAMTLAVVLLMIYVFYDVYFVGGDMADRIVTPIVFAVIWFLALRTPRYFYIEKDHIVVQFFIGHKLLDDIQSVRPILKGELKGWRRDKKNRLIATINPQMFDLAESMGWIE